MVNKYFNLLIQQVRHTGSIVAKIDSIVRYENDVKIIKEKLIDIMDNDAIFEKIMRITNND